jgi:hypothetical protein
MKNEIWAVLKKFFVLNEENQNLRLPNEDHHKISRVMELSVSWRNHSTDEYDEYNILVKQGYERKAAIQVVEKLRKGFLGGIDLLFYKENYDMPEFDSVRDKIPRVVFQY